MSPVSKERRTPFRRNIITMPSRASGKFDAPIVIRFRYSRMPNRLNIGFSISLLFGFPMGKPLKVCQIMRLYSPSGFLCTRHNKTADSATKVFWRNAAHPMGASWHITSITCGIEVNISWFQLCADSDIRYRQENPLTWIKPLQLPIISPSEASLRTADGACSCRLERR